MKDGETPEKEENDKGGMSEEREDEFTCLLTDVGNANIQAH